MHPIKSICFPPPLHLAWPSDSVWAPIEVEVEVVGMGILGRLLKGYVRLSWEESPFILSSLLLLRRRWDLDLQQPFWAILEHGSLALGWRVRQVKVDAFDKFRYCLNSPRLHVLRFLLHKREIIFCPLYYFLFKLGFLLYVANQGQPLFTKELSFFS